jgi:hypothetical protein
MVYMYFVEQLYNKWRMGGKICVFTYLFSVQLLLVMWMSYEKWT